MERKDIEHLAKLARIGITDVEADALAKDITGILTYVGEIKEITAAHSGKKEVGPLHNVMREDGEPHEPGIYTEALLNAAPERHGRYVKVKKIIGDKS